MLCNLCSDFTLESLIDWLETQYSTRSYPSIDSSACFTDVALGRWKIWL